MNEPAKPAHAQTQPIPPEVYDIGFGWDPAAEIDRLLARARDNGVQPQSALELGCGTGRLLAPLREWVPQVVGLEISPALAALARSRFEGEVVLGDMCAFDLSRSFDLIHTSANTVRHACPPEAIAGLWRCVGDHLAPNGVFIADLELGFAAEAAKVGRPAKWMLARDRTLVHVTWDVVEPPCEQTRCCRIAWTFEERRDDSRREYRESFPLRTYDADEFVRFATADGRLTLCGVFEPRDPYLFERPLDRAVGRMLVVLRRV